MKTYYFIAEEVSDNEQGIFHADFEIREKDYVIIPDYNNIPITAQVTKLISEYEAITKYHHTNTIIGKVDMTTFKKKQEAEVRKRILNDKMEDKIKDIKALELLEKYAGKDTDMAELLKQFKALEDTPDNGYTEIL